MECIGVKTAIIRIEMNGSGVTLKQYPHLETPWHTRKQSYEYCISKKSRSPAKSVQDGTTIIWTMLRRDCLVVLVGWTSQLALKEQLLKLDSYQLSTNISDCRYATMVTKPVADACVPRSCKLFMAMSESIKCNTEEKKLWHNESFILKTLFTPYHSNMKFTCTMAWLTICWLRGRSSDLNAVKVNTILP